MAFLEACRHWLSQSNNQSFLALVGAVAAAILWLVHHRTSRNVPGPEHPDMAAKLNIFAFPERALGPEHPDVALSLNTNWINCASMPSSMPPMLTALIDSVEEKKAQLDGLRPKWNSLSLPENDEYLEYRSISRGSNFGYVVDAENHAMAAHWMRKFAVKATLLDENIVRKLHRRVFAFERHQFGGVYRSETTRVYKAGALHEILSPVVFPDPAKVLVLLKKFGAWLREAPPGPASAFEAHYRLIAIHPFEDGNGRVARLLMNLLLIRGGYPPVPMRRKIRKTYLNSLERSLLTGDRRPYRVLMYQRLDATLGEYLSTLQEALPHPDATPPQTEPKL